MSKPALVVERDEVHALDTPGFAIHALRDGELASQVEAVPFRAAHPG